MITADGEFSSSEAEEAAQVAQSPSTALLCVQLVPLGRCRGKRRLPGNGGVAGALPGMTGTVLTDVSLVRASAP